MKRSTVPVLAVVAVLVLGANAARLVEAGRSLAARAPEAAAACVAWARGVGGDSAARAWIAALPARADAWHVGLALAALLAAASIVLAARGAWLAVEDRAPRRRVLAMARRGRAAAAIARRTGLPQDAVRTLLRPGREGVRLRA